MAAPRKRAAPAAKKAVVPPSVEERLAVVEKKVDFIFKRITKQAAEQMGPKLQETIEAQLLKQIEGEV